MRNWKNWLFPILTVLTVAALALLPLRLSVMEDGKLTGAVHAEELPADSNFPFKPPELPGRIWLLVQWQELPDNLTVMTQELEGAERDREMRRLREALADLGLLLHPDTAALLSEIDGDSWDWSRYYLRDRADLSSASFTMVSTYNKQLGASLSATLDGESGQLAGLRFHSAKRILFTRSPRELGETLLDRLGLEHELADDAVTEDVYGWAAFRLPACKSWFTVSQTDLQLSFSFHVDWETVDAALSEAYGYPTDAVSMQKR